MNKKRVLLIHIARKNLCLGDEAYRALLSEYGNVTSASFLDYRGFVRVMDRLQELGFVSTQRKAAIRSSDRAGMASAGQVALIRELWAKLSRDSSEVALDKWISRFGVDALRFVDAPRAQRILGALRAWEARKLSSAKSQQA